VLGNTQHYAEGRPLYHPGSWLGNSPAPSPFPKLLEGQVALPPEKEKKPFANHFWLFGGAGTFTVEHIDQCAMGALTAVLHGEKLFVARAPSPEKEGLPPLSVASQCSLLDVFSHSSTSASFSARSPQYALLTPGTYLYTPAGWPNAVYNTKPATLSTVFRFLHPEMFSHALRLRMAAFNPCWFSILSSALLLASQLTLQARADAAQREQLIARATRIHSAVALMINTWSAAYVPNSNNPHFPLRGRDFKAITNAFKDSLQADLSLN
jgi:hypothetical protein